MDVFAYGTLLWETLERKVPFDGFEPGEIRAKVEGGEPLRANYGLDNRLTQLVIDCRNVQASARPNFAKIVQTLAEVSASIR